MRSGKPNDHVRYTVRSVPPEVDCALRARASATGATLNSVIIEALAVGLGLHHIAPRRRDLDRFIGTWIEDPAFDAALAAQDMVDERAWR